MNQALAPFISKVAQLHGHGCVATDHYPPASVWSPSPSLPAPGHVGPGVMQAEIADRLNIITLETSYRDHIQNPSCVYSIAIEISN